MLTIMRANLRLRLSELLRAIARNYFVGVGAGNPGSAGSGCGSDDLLPAGALLFVLFVLLEDCCDVCPLAPAMRSLYLLARMFSTMPSSRNTPKTMLVAQVSTSPVLDPK